MKLTYLLFILSIILTGACATKSQSNKQYPPQFHDYPPNVQALIRSGKIAEGFDETQVRMAWGNPIRTRHDSRSTLYYWEYTTLETRNHVFQRAFTDIGKSIAQDTKPTVTVNQDPFYDKIKRRISFDKDTRKVTSFQTY